MLRIGSGYDVHRLVTGRRLVIGGVEIAYEKGLLGHSDADVLLHAICDALLGAAALGDIGVLFPDSDDKFKDISSLRLLEETVSCLKEHGYSVVNIDSTVITQAPKLHPYIDDMREKIAQACGIDASLISVKATTQEGLGFSGRGEGIAANAVCLIKN